MTVNELAGLLKADKLNVADGGREVKSGYACDLLSHAIGRAAEDCVWFTVMNNINVCAVATLADVSAVVLCEDIEPMSELLEKAKEQDVTLLKTKHDVYGAVKLTCGVI